jgi:hypothetical protein
VTDAEQTLLRSLAAADVVTFLPEDNSAAALATYEATVERLREMQKAGWIELEVNEDWVELEVDEEKRLHRGRPQPERGAEARCTDAGREALRLLGGT